MSNKQKKICRVCLKTVTREFFEINMVIRRMLHILLLTVDLNVTRDPVICSNCVKVAKKCLKFKLSCLDAERTMLLFSTDGEKNENKTCKENEYEQTVVDKNFITCRICMARMKRNCSNSLDLLGNEMTMFEMTSGFLPEMGIGVFNYPRICTMCRGNLKSFLTFLLNCLDTEGKIRSFCIEEGTDRMNEVNLGDVQNFLSKDNLKCAEKSPQTCTNKGELYILEDAERVYIEAYSGSIKLEQLDIKEEEMAADMFANEIVSDIISLKTSVHNTKKYTSRKEVDADIMVNSSNSKDDLEVKKVECSDTRLNKCVVYTHENELKKNVNRDFIINTGSSEAYKCSLCVYEAKYKSSLKKHMLVHKDDSEMKMSRKMYKCSLCPYESRHKWSLKVHVLKHKDVSEINIHKCSLCTFKTKHKRSLNKHTLVHKDVSEIKMHKCLLCAYEGKHTTYLKKHMLVHTNISEIKIYKCALCVYESKYKSSLKNHMLVHKDVTEIKMYNCPLCVYESKYKSTLKNHMLVHKDVTEIKMYNCSLCAYKCKRKDNLERHILVHKDVSEIKMYKCSLCVYVCKQESNLKKHMLVHKDVSEIKMYKCSLCGRETKEKGALEKHMLVHKDISEINMHKCPLCIFETKHKHSLKRHTLVHNDVSEIKVHKCSLCAYESKHTADLKRHMLVHKNVSEIKKF